MEAPEKIYIPTNSLLESGLEDFYVDHKTFDDDIEYVRKDAFIEKACKWLKDNVTYIHPRKGTKECMVNLTIFKDYMKGE